MKKYDVLINLFGFCYSCYLRSVGISNTENQRKMVCFGDFFEFVTCYLRFYMYATEGCGNFFVLESRGIPLRDIYIF